MSVRFRVDKLAEADLSAAASWYRGQATDLDLDFFEAVERAFDRVRDFPGTHERLQLNIYRVIVARFPFNVVYRFDESGIAIIAVYHSSRRPRIWRDRL